MLKISNEKGFVWVHESAGGHLLIPGGNDDCAAGAGTKINDPKRIFCEVRHDFYQLLPFSEIKRGSWYDFVFNINFDKNDIRKAYHKIWLNGQLVHQRYNQTLWLDQNGMKKTSRILILGSMDLKEIKLTNHYMRTKFTSAERAKHYY